jgi:hypothetical protein
MLHIAGNQNQMTDIPSRSFGSESKWHFKTNKDLLTFFNSHFPLPTQNSWSVCQPASAIATRVISILRMKPFTLEDWRRLPAAGKSIGTTGKPTQHLWEWTLTYRIPNSPNKSVCSQDLQRKSAQVSMVNKKSSKLHSQYGAHGRWPDDRAGLRLKSYKSNRIGMFSPTPLNNAGQLPQSGPTN